MTNKELVKRLAPYVYATLIGTLGLAIAIAIHDYSPFVRAILGVAVFYYSFKSYSRQVDNHLREEPFRYPNNVAEAFSGIFLGLAITLATLQIIDLIRWIILN